MAQTSLIPTVIALSKFFYENFPNISWYPNWYLGNPYNFLIGPVVPILLSIFKFFSIDFYFSYFFLLFLSLIIGSIGLFFLVRALGGEKRAALFSSLFYFLIPGSLFLFNYQNGLEHIAFNLLPFLFILFNKFLKEDSFLNSILLSFVISFLLLIDISVFLPLIVGFVSIFIVFTDKKKIEEKITLTVLVFLLAISLTTVWYTPGFWWVILSNPSVGGIPFLNLIGSIFKLLLNLLPVIFAVAVVKWRRLKPSGYLQFAVIFLGTFLGLTLIRFLVDPDFVMDWISFFPELQFGSSIILGSFAGKFSSNFEKVKSHPFGKLRAKVKNTNQKLKIFFFAGILMTVIGIDITIIGNITTSLAARQVKQFNNEDIYKNGITNIIRNNVDKDERIFLSGSSVFWINSSLNIQQVRGGNDPSSIHPLWAMGAFYLREGENPDLAKAWLKILGASYILVHESGSSELFKDFKKPETFSSFSVIEQQKGDSLYKENASIARVADREILNIKKPKDGKDSLSLYSYVSSIKTPVQSYSIQQNKIFVQEDLKPDEVISLAVTYDRGWKLVKGEGKLVRDNFGNIVIVPGSTELSRTLHRTKQIFELEYSWSFIDKLVPLFLSLTFILLVFKFDMFFQFLYKKFPKISLGLKEDEDDY